MSLAYLIFHRSLLSCLYRNINYASGKKENDEYSPMLVS